MSPPKSAQLLNRYRRLRDEGASTMRRREAYNDWFRQCCAEGRPPSALRVDSPDESERFWAQTVPGPDTHIYWTGPRLFLRNDGKKRSPQRWAWAKANGSLSHYAELEITCGERNCVNVEHMRIRPRAERRIRFSDEQAYGAAQVLAIRLGHAPSRLQWDAAKLPVTTSAIEARFGTWETFCRKAGLDPWHPGQTTNPGACTAAIRALAGKLGHAPSRGEWLRHTSWLRDHHFPTSPTTISHQLGASFAAAVARVLKDRKAA